MFLKNEIASIQIPKISTLNLDRKKSIYFQTNHSDITTNNHRTIYECVEKRSMTIVCNIWIICLELYWLFYDPSWMLQLSEFVWTLCSLAWVVFNNFLFLDATDRLVAMKALIFLRKPIPPFSFREHSL